MDKLGASITLTSALKHLELLEQAIQEGNESAISDRLHNIRRELYLLREFLQQLNESQLLAPESE